MRGFTFSKVYKLCITPSPDIREPCGPFFYSVQQLTLVYFQTVHSKRTGVVQWQGMKLMAVLRASYSFLRQISPSVEVPEFMVLAVTYALGHYIARSWHRNRDLLPTRRS
jgi:hypothetical protein